MKRILKRVLKKASRTKRTKAAAAAGQKRVKAARLAAKAGSPHAEPAKPTGSTPAVASGTKAAVARKQKTAARKRKGSGGATLPGDAEAELRRLRSARRKLERQLTAAVQEIGLLRQYEMRSRFLEAEVQKRDGQLADLRRQYETRIHDLESRGGIAVSESEQGRLI